ncbi:hypothetical protein Y032_0072g703 [Ancylostoma ceylanicum]|nr:hypothetical protein Y032_0072g703 [Ancylostoma ceylanicum]
MSVFVPGELDMDLRSGRLSRKFTTRRPYSTLLTITEGVALPPTTMTGERSSLATNSAYWLRHDIFSLQLLAPEPVDTCHEHKNHEQWSDTIKRFWNRWQDN